jgi:hypothetical protein
MPDTLRERVGRWGAAEDKLHAVVFADPDVYERSLRLVRLVADALGSVRSAEDLAEADDRAHEIVRGVISGGGIGADGIDLSAVEGAAFALRYREVLRDVARREANARISAARERGDRWVVLSESGQAGAIPYTRVEMRLPSGEAIRMSADADIESGLPSYMVETFALDPATGDPLPARDAGFSRRTFDDRATWERAIEELRADREGSV